MKKVRVVVFGALGRMGRAILDAMAADPGFHLKGALVRERSDVTALGDVPAAHSRQQIAPGDVIIDVTRAESVSQNIAWAVKTKTPYVLAVTGLDRKTEAEVYKASKKIPVVVAPNLSVGVAVLNEAVRITAALLPDADIEIVETHHKNKMDAPSGTALALAGSILLSGKGKRQVIMGRSPKGSRNPGNIHIHSVRGGDVIGEHTLAFFSDGERLELGHVATSRAIFARGALRAARFIVGKRPGIYTMRDVLGLKR